LCDLGLVLRRLLACCGYERGRFLPTAPSIDRASDIPVASPSSTRYEPDLRRLVVCVGECEGAAETTVTACP
jgi:hypothetical protein